ncbi:MAG: ATP synthase F1 subunit epsilon [Lachnospiraceae bacterium]|nr:ATP synthase F1 subunit epsilon [Lachnospiraceae bacterium]
MADDRAFKLRVITPDRVFYEGEVIMVELKTTEGEIGVLKRHIPLTAVIAPGVLYIKESEEEIKVAALHSGFVEVLQDSVTILAEVVEWPSEIDEKRAEEARIRAERRLSEKPMGTDLNRATLALERSVVRIETLNKGNSK